MGAFQLLFCAANRLASRVIRFDNQDDTVRQLSNHGGLRLMAKRRRADKKVIKRLAQFGEALSIVFDGRVKARLLKT